MNKLVRISIIILLISFISVVSVLVVRNITRKKADQGTGNENLETRLYLKDELTQITDDPEQYSSEWNWKDDVVMVEVDSAFEVDESIRGKIVHPLSMKSEESRIFPVECDGRKLEYSMEATPKTDAQPPVPGGIFTNATAGSVLHTKCLDESCEKLGGPCLLRIKNNE